MLPKTLWIPNTSKHVIPQLDHGLMDTVNGVVIHINDGSTPGTLEWWAQPGHEADGAQLQVSKDGGVIQTMALNRKAWHAGTANNVKIGIEHEGWSLATKPDDHRTHTQLHASANRVAWIHHECNLGKPVHLKTVFPHSYGGAAWGGHTGCPGPWDWELYMNLCTAAYMDHWGR